MVATNPVTSIVPRKYKSGSIIYFEGDRGDNIYILKSGTVILTSRKLDTGEEEKEAVKAGEFFGVKSALGKYPREETAQTFNETVVLVLTSADFERLVLANVSLVRKMLRVFSNQLRRIGRTVRQVMGETDQVNAEAELFKIGEHYYRNGKFNQALYAYKRYMVYYPDRQYSPVAMKRIQAIESGQARPIIDNPAESFAASSGISSSASSASFDDFSTETPVIEPASSAEPTFDFDDGPSSSGPADPNSLHSEMDDFLSGDDSNNLDAFNFDAPVQKSLKDKLADARSKMQGGDVQGAFAVLKEISAENPGSPDDRKVVDDATFELGNCYLAMKNMREAMNVYSSILKSTSGTANMKGAMYKIGNVFEMSQQKDKAKAYYTKVVSMAPQDNWSLEAKKRLQSIG